MHPSSDTALLLRETFEDHPITFVTFRGEPVVVARELGAALGYADPSKIGEKIRGDWSGDFIEGTDYRLLDGADLAAFKAEWPDTPESGASTLDRTRRALLVLTESGWWMVAQKTEKALGVKLRRFLVEVLKKIARGEAIGATQPSALPRTPMEVTAYDRETRLYAGAMMRAGRKSDAADYMRSREQARGLFLSGPTTPTAPPSTQTQLPFAPTAEAAPVAPTPKPDHDDNDWPRFIRAWLAKYGPGRPVNEPKLVTAIVSAADLYDLGVLKVEAGSDLGFASKMGKLLRPRIDTVIDGYQIVKRGSTIRGYALKKAA